MTDFNKESIAKAFDVPEYLLELPERGRDGGLSEQVWDALSAEWMASDQMPTTEKTQRAPGFKREVNA